VNRRGFGWTLNRNPTRAAIYSAAKDIALKHAHEKLLDVQATWWDLRTSSTAWRRCELNLEPRLSRKNWVSSPSVYDYSAAGPDALIVDFANAQVGGGCFHNGFVQEEQMVAQSTDMATYLYRYSPVLLEDRQVFSLQNIYMDSWWGRDGATRKEHLLPSDIEDKFAGPFTVLAVNAPQLGGRNRWSGRVEGYNRESLEMLTTKIGLMYAVAVQLRSPRILGGLLGGGAFRNNRPLVLLLHLLLQPRDIAMDFHYPIFWSFCGCPIKELEEAVLTRADNMLENLRAQGVQNLGDVLEVLLRSDVPSSDMDDDLASSYALIERAGAQPATHGNW